MMNAHLSALLREIDLCLANRFPPVFESLRPGAPEGLLDALESEVGFTLPETFRQLYLWHDGQEIMRHSQVPALFGNMQFWPLSEVRKYAAEWKDNPLLADFAEDDGDFPSHPSEYIRSSYMRIGWITFSDSPAAQSLCLDLDPDHLGSVGQIIGWSADKKDRYMLAKSLEEFLEKFLYFINSEAQLINLDSGVYSYISLDGSYETNIFSLLSR